MMFTIFNLNFANKNVFTHYLCIKIALRRINICLIFEKVKLNNPFDFVFFFEIFPRNFLQESAYFMLQRGNI